MTVEVLDIPAQGSLDSINVYWRNWEPGRGQVTIVCWGSSWTAYFGAMGGRTIQTFFGDADEDYLVKKLGITQWLKQTKRHENYLARIVSAIKAALEAQRVLESIRKAPLVTVNDGFVEGI